MKVITKSINYLNGSNFFETGMIIDVVQRDGWLRRIFKKLFRIKIITTYVVSAVDEKKR